MSVVLPQVREGEASSRSSEAPDLPAGPEIRGVQVQGYRPTNAEGMRVSSDTTVAVWIQLPFAVAVAGGGASSTSVSTGFADALRSQAQMACLHWRTHTGGAEMIGVSLESISSTLGR